MDGRARPAIWNAAAGTFSNSQVTTSTPRQMPDRGLVVVGADRGDRSDVEGGRIRLVGIDVGLEPEPAAAIASMRPS